MYFDITAFDITSPGKMNAGFIFLVGAIEYKWKGCFCIQTTCKKVI